MELVNLSLVPSNYKDKDPRTLPFLYPETINIVAYAKKAQSFYFYQQLELAEEIAKKQGYILLPWSCIHWQRAKNYGHDRKIKIGRKSYFMLKEHEMTKGEKMKLLQYIEEMKGETR